MVGVHAIDCDIGVDCYCGVEMQLQWPTWEEFVAGNLETRAMSDARGSEAVEDDAWQTNVMVRISSEEGQQLDLEPMPLWYETGDIGRGDCNWEENGRQRRENMKNGFSFPIDLPRSKTS